MAGIWRNRSILGQILAVVIGIELAAAIIGAAAIIYAMRHQNEAEMGAAMARAETLVLAEIASALTHTSLEATLETLALRLPVIEPVEIEVVDTAGKVVSRTGAPDPSDDVDFPEWYGILRQSGRAAPGPAARGGGQKNRRGETGRAAQGEY